MEKEMDLREERAFFLRKLIYFELWFYYYADVMHTLTWVSATTLRLESSSS